MTNPHRFTNFMVKSRISVQNPHGFMTNPMDSRQIHMDSQQIHRDSQQIHMDSVSW